MFRELFTRYRKGSRGSSAGKPRDLSDKVEIEATPHAEDFHEALTQEQSDIGSGIYRLEELQPESEMEKKLRETLAPIESAEGQEAIKIREAARDSAIIVHAYLNAIRTGRTKEVKKRYGRVALHANVVTDSLVTEIPPSEKAVQEALRRGLPPPENKELPFVEAWSKLLYGSRYAYKDKTVDGVSKFLDNSHEKDGSKLESITINPLGAGNRYAGMLLRYVGHHNGDSEKLAVAMLEIERGDESKDPARQAVSILVETENRVRGWNVTVDYKTHEDAYRAMAELRRLLKSKMPLEKLATHDSASLEGRFEQILGEAGIYVKLSHKPEPYA